MESEIVFQREFAVRGGDYVHGGSASCTIKSLLKEIGIDHNILRRVAVAAYEAEMNVVMYAERGVIRCTLTATEIRLRVDDVGPGIPDIEEAMQPGYSTATHEMREMGFGAGMGLPNIKKNADSFEIVSCVGGGTKLLIVIALNGKDHDSGN